MSKSTHNLEEAILKQKIALKEIRNYANGEGRSQEAHIIEEKLFKMVLDYGRAVLQEIIYSHEGEVREKTFVNKNGKELPYARTSNKQYLSIFGYISIPRRCFWEFGVSGEYPLDKALNLPEKKYSYLLQKWTQGRIAEVAYGEAINSIMEIFNITLYKEAQEKITQATAPTAEDYYENKELENPEIEGKVLAASADCKGVPMVPSEQPQKTKEAKVRRGKGDKKKGLRKDAVVTSDYSFDPSPREPQEIIEALMRVNGQKEKKQQESVKKEKVRVPKNKHVAASMYGKEIAFKNMADRILKRNPEQDKKIFIMLDGEKALKTKILEEFKKRHWMRRIDGICLDIIHAVEYLWDAASAIHGEKSKEKENWVRDRLMKLLEGKVGWVISGLKQVIVKNKKLSKSKKKVLHRTVTYYENHKKMMKYDEYLAKGYPIATGVIEGACGCLVKDRTDGSGMKWTSKGAQAVLDLRAVKKNGDWENFWEFYIEKEKNRLY